MYNPDTSHGALGGNVNNQRPKSVYLKGSSTFYQKSSITKVAPAAVSYDHVKPFQSFNDTSIIISNVKPVLNLMRIIGVFPVIQGNNGFCLTKTWIAYSFCIFLFIVGYIGYIHWDNVEIVKSSEGKFEEAVIDYLFTVYLLPIIINPIIWYQCKKQTKVLTDLNSFETYYNTVAKKELSLYLGNKPLMISILLPIISCCTMVVTHVTMVNFRFIQVIPYCYINTVTYLVGGAWFIYCDVIGKTATAISEDFQLALKHVGPSSKVAEYRSLWMMLSKITRDVGNSFSYILTFLCLYLFLIITLTIYGLLSQLQGGFGVKDIGLTITAVFAVILLFFICDEAHYASNCVKVYFQKKILLVELSWMNQDAQQEINMFLRATEMNPTDMSLGGFFDVNRNLFKSLLATMVTYLVVLLQFQISIPEDSSIDLFSNITIKSPK